MRKLVGNSACSTPQEVHEFLLALPVASIRLLALERSLGALRQRWEPEARAMLSTFRDVLRIFSCNDFANECLNVLVFAQHFWSAGGPKAWQKPHSWVTSR